MASQGAVAVGHIDLGSCRQQLLHRIDLAARRGKVHRRVASGAAPPDGWNPRNVVWSPVKNMELYGDYMEII